MQLQSLVDALYDVVLAHNAAHSDETPVQVLMPDANATSVDIRAAVHDFNPRLSGEHARAVLQDWKGKLVCDDFGGCKASFALGVIEIGCMADARRRFFDLHATNQK